MTPAAEAILEHRDRIVTGQLKWVGHKPEEPGQCCVGYACGSDRLLHFVVPVDQARVDQAREAQDALDAEAKSRGEISFDQWNDHVCRTPQQAVEFLSRAAERLAEWDEWGVAL